MLQEAPKLDQGGGMKALLQEKKTPKSGHPMQLTDLKVKML
jgi:tagatose-1,6-bisphosphate aldolase